MAYNEKMQKNNTDNPFTVLLVENKVAMKQVLISTFIKKGMEIIVAKNTAEAKNILEEGNYNYDIVLTNLDNEPIKCFELCEIFRAKYSKLELPFVGYSSNVNSQIISNAFSFGYNDFFSFPFNTVEFNCRMQMMIEAKKLSDTVKKLQNIVDIRTQVFKMNTHDLKNPLSSIFSLSGIPVSSFNDSEEISQTMDVIHKASKIMISLVNSNLEFLNVTSETIKLEMETVDIVALINEIVEINSPLAKNKNQSIIYTYPENVDCIVISDHNKLYQAINNIVGNAIKFSPFDKKIWINVSKEETKIKIKIKDEGPGFKKEEVDTVLVKFGKHSATPTGDEISTGLGLLITKQIINLSKGEIYLESEEGEGALFTLEFPIPDDKYHDGIKL